MIRANLTRKEARAGVARAPPAPAKGASADGRAARLRRMQALATGLLVAMAGVYVAASLAVPRWPAAGYLRAFAEAAVVGACADWFAVTALFRRPLGLPIPHTAISPRAKARIGEALGRFLVENFLSPRVLDAKLRELELAAWGGAWLTREENARRVAAACLKVGPELIRALPAGALEEMVGAAALAAARATPAAPTASALLAAVWDEGRAQPLIDRGAALLSGYLEQHQEVILGKVQGQSWRWLPAFVDRAIARKITGGVLQLLADVQVAEHPWRRKLGDEVERWIARLAEDPELRVAGEALKAQILADPGLAEHAHRLWSEVQGRLQAEWSEGAEALQARLERLVRELGGWLAADPAVQRSLNTGARAFVRRVLAPHREEIGRFVAQTVDGWDARSLVERLELQVGPDLQFIRLNGTLVGGLVGLALYAASRWVGLG